MTEQEFAAEVEGFIRQYCEDFFNASSYEAMERDNEWEPLRATVTITAMHRYTYTVPLIEFGYGIAVEADEDSYLDADDGGMFAYLFFEVVQGRQGTAADQDARGEG